MVRGLVKQLQPARMLLWTNDPLMGTDRCVREDPVGNPRGRLSKGSQVSDDGNR